MYLAVADLRVPVCIGGEDSSQSGNSCVALKGRVLWQRAMQVPLNFICS